MFRIHALALIATLAIPPGYAAAQAPENSGDVEKSAKPAIPARIAGQDEQLARRLYLDLLGRSPSAEEMRDFLEDTSGNRTERLIDRLLKNPEFASRKSKLDRRATPWLIELEHDFFILGASDAKSLLGVSLEPADETTRAQLGLADEQGVVVTEVAADSPAAKAGIENHDVLVAARGKPLADQGALVQVLKEADGAEVALELIRGGERKTVAVKPNPPESASNLRALQLRWPDQIQDYYVGIQVNSLTPALRTQLKLEEDQGVVVGEVLPDTAAARDGLKEHDVLLSLGGEPLREPGDVTRRLQESGGEPVEFKLLRAGKPQTITVTPETRKQPRAVWRNFAVPDGGNILFGGRPAILDFETVSPPILDPAASWFKRPAPLAKPEEFRQELETLSQHVEALRKLIDSLKQRVPQESEKSADELEEK